MALKARRITTSALALHRANRVPTRSTTSRGSSITGDDRAKHRRVGRVKPYAQTRRCVRCRNISIADVAGVSVVPDSSIYLRVKYPLPDNPPLVSIIIPTRDRADLLRHCLESIFAKTDYPRFEVIVIDNESREPEALEYLAKLPPHQCGCIASRARSTSASSTMRRLVGARFVSRTSE